MTRTFEASAGTRVELVDLPGGVEVRPGPVGRVTVTVTGTAEACEQVDVRQGDGAVQVRGARPSGVVIGGVHVSGPGPVVVGRTMRFDGVTINCGAIVGGRVVVNGVDVTDAVADAAGQPRPVHPARVTVTVPAGTRVEVDGCARAEIAGVAGPVRADLSGQDVVTVTGATGVRAHASGQAEIRLTAGTGPVDVTASGLARVRAGGTHDEVDVEASGQAQVDVHGDLGQVAGRASGMSTVSVTGQVRAHRLRTSGMATARVNGRAVSR